eukprot:CAMPEP_0171214264 /NCGR_PEP_ID=MMETSP0790-20130122/31069_1 /TAXON_ID=2925 /ORGANISM="Alexandrium catenella, Strain OF101" /LENGTH=328 /DNA_ID=CAMNT_0011679995 /DNA_START=33 /DNA_END=1019 /DNA_ORIENTATION=-
MQSSYVRLEGSAGSVNGALPLVRQLRRVGDHLDVRSLPQSATVLTPFDDEGLAELMHECDEARRGQYTKSVIIPCAPKWEQIVRAMSSLNAPEEKVCKIQEESIHQFQRGLEMRLDALSGKRKHGEANVKYPLLSTAIPKVTVLDKDCTHNSALYCFKLDMNFDMHCGDAQARGELSKLIVEEVAGVMGMPPSHFEIKEVRKGSIEVVLLVANVTVGLALAGWATYSLWFDGSLTPEQIRRRYVAAGTGLGIATAAAVGGIAGTPGGLVGIAVGMAVGEVLGGVLGALAGRLVHDAAEQGAPVPARVGMQINGQGVKFAVQFHPPPMQ